VSAYAEERGLGMPRRAGACVALVMMLAAASGAHAGRARNTATPIRRSRLRHRCVVRPELVAFFCEVARRSPAPIGCAAVGVAVGGTALPVVVRDALVGAAGEQLRGDVDEAVGCRMVQRCPPAGRGGHGRIGVTIGHRRPPRRTAPPAKAHIIMLWVFF
jgi:hypothetical protein